MSAAPQPAATGPGAGPPWLPARHARESNPGGDTCNIAAFDMARAPMATGGWSQRTQAPSGLGYLLENRIAIARLFPKAFMA